MDSGKVNSQEERKRKKRITEEHNIRNRNCRQTLQKGRNVEKGQGRKNIYEEYAG